MSRMGRWVFERQEANSFYEDFDYVEQINDDELENNIGKQNEHSNPCIGSFGKREVNQPSELRPAENTIDSMYQEAPPF